MQTQIRYQLPEPTNVKIQIFNLKGEEVCRLVDGHKDGGTFEIMWNGKDNLGRDVSSGVYLVRLQTAAFSDIKKLTVMK